MVVEEVIPLSNPAQGSCQPHYTRPPGGAPARAAQSPLTSAEEPGLGKHTGLAELANPAGQPASTRSYTAFKTQLQVVSSMTPP